jgi:uncharacterized repeat protein (TIGR04138 family)
MPDDAENSMEEVIHKDGRYPLEAFAFLHEGLGSAVKAAYGAKPQPAAGPRHISGRQLCLALRDLAIQRWGLLARTVLDRWNIRSTIDFGNMVYLLVNNDFMKKTDEDSLEDFRDVFNFEQAFGQNCKFEMKE